MTAYLRVVGTVLLLAGIVVCIMATRMTLADDTYYQRALAVQRHSDHILFQAEYQAALVRHVAYIVAAVMSALIGVVGSAVTFGLAAILQRLERMSGPGGPAT